ncbi:MAG: glycosyltransferase family 2 protein [Sulfolobales archaeon]
MLLTYLELRLQPPVAIVWVNYNSMSFIDLAKRSLRAIASLDYRDFSLVFVDNGSNDGSYEVLRGYVKELRIDVKIVRLEHNIGFPGANNIGYLAMPSDAQYYVAINNDAVPERDSLKRIVDYMEGRRDVASAQGILLDLGSGLIDTIGCYINELMISIHPFSGEPLEKAVRALPTVVTYVNGAYMVVKREAIERCIGETPFPWHGFLYIDDNILGLRLWQCSYRSISIPVLAGYHRRGSTSGRGATATYYAIRSWVASGIISNSRYRNIIPIIALSTAIRRSIRKRSAIISRAVIDGIKLGEKLIREIGVINIYKAPILYISLSEVLGSMTSLKIVERYRSPPNL